MLERHGGNFFVELGPLIVLFHVELDFLFWFTSDLISWLFVGVVLSEFYVEFPFYF